MDKQKAANTRNPILLFKDRPFIVKDISDSIKDETIGPKNSRSSLEELFFDLGRTSKCPVYIGDFETTEFQSLLAEHQEHFFYPEEFGIYSDNKLKHPNARYYITKDQLKKINYNFIAGVIHSKKPVICAKFLGGYGTFFDDLAGQDKRPWGTLGEIGTLLYSGYDLDSCVQRIVSAEDISAVMRDFGIVQDENLQQKIANLQNSILFKSRIVFEPHQGLSEPPDDFLTADEIYELIKHTRFEAFFRNQHDILIRLRKQ